MNCNDFQTCIEMQLSNALLRGAYQTGLIYLITALAVLLLIIYFWRRSIDANSRQDPAGRPTLNLLLVLFGIGLLLTMPILVARAVPALVYRAMSVPAGVSVSQLSPDVLRATANLVTALVWFGISGIVLQGFGLGLLQRWVTQAPARNISGAAKAGASAAMAAASNTPPAVTRMIEAKELTRPRSDTSPTPPQQGATSSAGYGSNTQTPYQRGSGARAMPGEADATKPRPMTLADIQAAAPAGIAWLEWQYAWQDRYPEVPEWPKRRRIARQLVIGRLPESTLSKREVEEFVPLLPHAPDWFSRHQVIIEPTISGYRMRNGAKADGAPVFVNGRTVPPGPEVIALRDGDRIVIGEEPQSYDLQFRQIGTPLLEDTDTGEMWQLKVPGPLCGDGPLGWLDSRSLAEITFDIRRELPGYYIQANGIALDKPVRIIKDNLSSDTVVAAEPVRLDRNDRLAIADKVFVFKLVSALGRPLSRG